MKGTAWGHFFKRKEQSRGVARSTRGGVLDKNMHTQFSLELTPWPGESVFPEH